MNNYAIEIYTYESKPYNYYPGGFIPTSTTASIITVYRKAADVLIMENGILTLIDDEYNTISGFANGQWISFERIVEDDSNIEMDNATS